MNSDKKTRMVSVPFKANLFNDDLVRNSFPNIYPLTEIRFSLPKNEQITTLYLNLYTDVACSFRIAIGRFKTGTADLYEAETVYTDAEILASHRKLTGTEDKYDVVTSLLIDGLSLLNEIPKRGDANFKEDGFVLLLDFDTVPDVAGGAFTLFVTGSSLLGVK